MRGILLIVAGICISMAVSGGGNCYWFLAVSDVILYIVLKGD